MQKKKTLRDLIGLQVRGSHGKTNDLHSSMRVIGVSPANMLPTEQRVAWSTGKSKGVTSQKVAQGEVTAWNHKGVLLCKLSLHPQSTPWLKSSQYPCSSRGCAGDTGLCHCGGVEGLSKKEKKTEKTHEHGQQCDGVAGEGGGGGCIGGKR